MFPSIHPHHKKTTPRYMILFVTPNTSGFDPRQRASLLDGFPMFAPPAPACRWA